MLPSYAIISLTVVMMLAVTIMPAMPNIMPLMLSWNTKPFIVNTDFAIAYARPLY